MKKRPKALKTIIIIGVIAIVAGLGIYRIAESIKPPIITEKLPVNVVTAEVEIGTIYATSPLSGRIEPIDTAIVIPLASGEVTHLAVALGDQVKKGDLLFKIDSTQMSVSFNSAKLALNNVKEEYNRMKSLYEEGAVSLQQYQGVETQYNVAKENFKAAADALSYSTVNAPISGYVTSVDVSVGSLASQVSPAITIADVSQLQINTGLSEYLINKVKVGDKVDIFVKTISKDPYPGTITALSPAPAIGTLTYPITISVDDDTDEIKAGMFAEVQIVSDMKKDVIAIPSGAVYIKSGESKVVLLNGNMPRIVPVETGLDNGTMVEIISGLNPGDIVVIIGQQYVVDGEPVNIID